MSDVNTSGYLTIFIKRWAEKLNGPRWSIFSRVMAAIFGGYLFTSIVIALLAILLPGSRAEAVLAAMLLSFLIYAGVVMWVFACRTASHAWTGILLSSLVMGSLLLIDWNWS